MATIKLGTALTIIDTNSAKLPIITTKTISYTKKTDTEYSIPASTEQILYNPSADTSESTTNLTFLYIIVDGTTELEIETDTGNEVGREMVVVTLEANIPFILGSDTSRANIIAFDGFGGTIDVIDKITAKAGSASITARIITAE